MIIDKLLEFGTDFDVAQTAETYLFTNQIDLSAAGLDIGNGQPLYLVIVVTGGDEGVITGGTAGTLQFRLVSDDTASIHATTCSVHLITKAFVTDDEALNELNLGDVLVYPLPVGGGPEPYERYLGLQAIVATTTTTEGTVTAFLTTDPHGNRHYADANN